MTNVSEVDAWSVMDIAELQRGVENGDTPSAAARLLLRSEAAVIAKARELGLMWSSFDV